MADLTIIAGECGRGTGTYDTGLFTVPQGLGRGVETVAAVILHGGVEGRQTMMEQVVTGLRENAALRGGVALAQTIDPSNSLAIAASVVSVGLTALDGAPRQKALIEVQFEDGASFVGTADAGVAALIENDRRVLLLAAPRLRSHQPVTAQEQIGESVTAKMLAAASGTAGAVASGAASVAGSAVSSALGFLMSKTKG
ncbi:hypothetical protein [Methylorubrum extorquens]|uniref:Uncharacterized protein n=2 Tax=Methylorubrum extorquens TaxID=408 RepID=B7KRJ2_METC4|nr:hypothetical protein [Methylorubrum extorquens]ACK85519.1 hypothetical protein Mchl_4745 [Methylorubrum extorquens CM4]WHQ69520.1 hypothetical protein KEC54_24805 [Methylorubrum extorquens]